MTKQAIQIDIAELPSMGWLTFDYQGEENTYFRTEDGSLVFVKI